jgi:hypothetical protein
MVCVDCGKKHLTPSQDDLTEALITDSKPECPKCGDKMDYDPTYKEYRCLWIKCNIKEDLPEPIPKCEFCGRKMINYNGEWICNHGCTSPAVTPSEQDFINKIPDLPIDSEALREIKKMAKEEYDFYKKHGYFSFWSDKLKAQRIKEKEEQDAGSARQTDFLIFSPETQIIVEKEDLEWLCEKLAYYYERPSGRYQKDKRIMNELKEKYLSEEKKE